MPLNKKYPFLLSSLDDLPSINFAGYEFKYESELTPLAKKAAIEVLKETEEKKQTCIAELRELLRQEESLVCPLDNDHWCIKFLRARDYNVPETFKLIRKHYRFKIKYAEYFKDFVPSSMTKLYEHMIFMGSPELDDQGRRIIIAEVGKKWKHRIVSIKDLFRVCLCIMEAASLDENTQILGGVIILDVKGFNLARANKITPQIIKMGIKWIENCIPVKIQAIHVLNENNFVDLVWSMIKPLLKQDFRQNIFFHGSDWTSLHKHIPPRCLFTYYGGDIVIPPLPSHDELEAQYGEWKAKGDREFQVINSYGYRDGKKK
ncbi:hypothetical protein DMENIID0001_066880 [Sergentomyia squamirostris]